MNVIQADSYQLDSIVALVNLGTLNALQQILIHISTRKQINSAIWTAKLNILQGDVSTHTRTTTNHIARNRIILCTRRTANIPHDDIRNAKLTRKLVASRQILLPIALGNLNSVVHVADGHGIVGNIVYATSAASALQITGESCGSAGPDFYARAVAGVGH
jgi:hypothetical protein